MLKDHTSYANMDRYQSLLFFLKVDTVRKPPKRKVHLGWGKLTVQIGILDSYLRTPFSYD